jgi:NAD(P) transhydrogenase subunit beta
MTGLPEMVGAYNGFGGLAAAIEGFGLYLDPNATNLMRGGDFIAEQSDEQLWVQGIALVLSIIIGMMTFTGSMVAVLKLHGTSQQATSSRCGHCYLLDLPPWQLGPWHF